MMELIKADKNYNFVGLFIPCALISSLLVGLSLIGAFTKMNYGVDFRGGAEIQAKFGQAVTMENLRATMSASGFGDVSIQTIGDASQNEVLVKVQAEESELNAVTQKVDQTLKEKYASQGVEIRKIDIVGPKAGAQLRLSGFLAMFWAILAIMVYVGLRFDFKFAPGAIIALIHDVAVVLGVYVVTGTPFTLQTVAALLAVIGYSINDTVVIYDRIRENEQKYPGLDLKAKINKAVNETLPRTILTSGLTLMSCVSLLAFGGEAIRDFSLAMTVGVISGCYSTIYIATPITILFEKLLPPPRPSAGKVTTTPSGAHT